MNKYQKGDCRAKGKPEGTVSQVRFLGKKQGYPEPESGKNREMRRTDHHFRGIRMNTTGVPLGFNHVTLGEHCADSGNPGRRPNDTPFKGRPGTKIVRRMFRKFGAREVLQVMYGKEDSK